MSISDVSMNSQLATMATDMQAENVQQRISTSVLKQIQDSQQQQGQALVAMISQRPTLDGTGSIVNVAA